MVRNMSNKVVVVSGGANGLCRMQVEALLECGANISVIGKNTGFTEQAASELETDTNMGNQVLVCSGVDVREFQQVQVAINKTLEVFGRIDMVISGTAANILQDYNHISSSGWDHIVEIDSTGCLNLAMAVFEQFSHNEEKRFVILDPSVHTYEVPIEVAGPRRRSNRLLVEHLYSHTDYESGASGICKIEQYGDENNWQSVIYGTILPYLKDAEEAERIAGSIMRRRGGSEKVSPVKYPVKLAYTELSRL